MMTRALLVAGGLLVASLGSAAADSVTATVLNWGAASRTITLEDFSQLAEIPPTITLPADLAPGDQVTVDYEADDHGVASYNSITVVKDIAKRLIPNDKRG